MMPSTALLGETTTTVETVLHLAKSLKVTRGWWMTRVTISGEGTRLIREGEWIMVVGEG